MKDEESAHLVASAWRHTIREIVKAFAERDYALERGVQSVVAPSAATARQIGNYIAAFGETLIELPDETWATSAAQWMGSHWEIVIDLWTAQSGQSDLILSARIFEVEGGFSYRIDSVHVP